MTSAAVVAVVKRVLQAKKVGHAGTLDPLATGLLIIGVDEGTKLLANYLKLPKTYEAEILLGEKRSTGDLEGEVIEAGEVSNLLPEDAKQAVLSMVGKRTLPVPVYSALKRGGESLYKKARRGERVEAPLREMVVRSARYGDISKGTAGKIVMRATFDVESGVYIRSLAEELGRRLGYPATLAGLRRTRVGEFRVEDALTLEDIELLTPPKEPGAR